MKKATDDRLDEPSVRFKRGMNRIFREIGGVSKIPHPEVDNWFQRTRSWFIVKLHLKPYTPKFANKKTKR